MTDLEIHRLQIGSKVRRLSSPIQTGIRKPVEDMIGTVVRMPNIRDDYESQLWLLEFQDELGSFTWNSGPRSLRELFEVYNDSTEDDHFIQSLFPTESHSNDQLRVDRIKDTPSFIGHSDSVLKAY